MEEERSRIEEIFKGIGLGILLIILGFLMPIGVIIISLIYLALIIFFYAKGRSGIGLGLILTVLIPIAIVGGCLLII